MLRRTFFLRAAAAGACGLTTVGTTGCGLLLHSERSGQPHSNQLDWKIVALDGLGLLLFFVPGVIAFAVDFYTGTIYLPCDHYSHLPSKSSVSSRLASLGVRAMSLFRAKPSRPEMSRGAQFVRLHVPDQELHPQNLEQIVACHQGDSISLVGSNARISRLSLVEDFEQQCQRHRKDSQYGSRIEQLFKV